MSRLLEDERNRVLDALSEAFSRDRIGLEDYERLVTETSAAKSLADLENVAGRNGLALQTAPASHAQPAQRTYSPSRNAPNLPSTSVAIFSGSELKGKFRVNKGHKALAVFGGVDIDLRDAEIPEGGMVIDCVAAFGGIEIKVPDDVNVVTNGFGIFGGFSSKHNDSEIPGAPTIHVRGMAIFGGVDVKIRPRKNQELDY